MDLPLQGVDSQAVTQIRKFAKVVIATNPFTENGYEKKSQLSHRKQTKRTLKQN
jgi:hypothetical protein